MSVEINYEIDSIIEQLNRLKHAVQLNCRNANTSAIELLPSKIKLPSRDSSTESRKKSPKESPKEKPKEKNRFRVKTLTKADLSPETLAMLAAPDVPDTPTEKIKESPKEKIKESPKEKPKKERFRIKTLTKDDLSPDAPDAPATLDAPTEKINESPKSPFTVQQKKSRFTVKHISPEKGGVSRKKYE